MSSSALPSSDPRDVIDVDAVDGQDVDVLAETQVVSAETQDSAGSDEALHRCARVPLFPAPAAGDDDEDEVDACSQRVVYGDNDNAELIDPVIDPTLAVVIPDTDEGEDAAEDEPGSTRSKRSRDSLDWDTDSVLASIVDSVPLALYAAAAGTVEVGEERFAPASMEDYLTCEQHVHAFLQWHAGLMAELLATVLGTDVVPMEAELGVDSRGFVRVDGDKSVTDYLRARFVTELVWDRTSVRLSDGTTKHTTELVTGDVTTHLEVLRAVMARQQYAEFVHLARVIAEGETLLRSVRHMKGAAARPVED